MTRIDDPVVVREQYASELGLAARKSIYTDATGLDSREVVFQAVAEARPQSASAGDARS